MSGWGEGVFARSVRVWSLSRQLEEGRELRVGMLPGLACVLYKMEILTVMYAVRVITGQSNMVFTAPPTPANALFLMPDKDFAASQVRLVVALSELGFDFESLLAKLHRF